MRRSRRIVVVVFDGVSLGITSFAFGVFDLAVYYGVLPQLDIRVVRWTSDVPAQALTAA